MKEINMTKAISCMPDKFITMEMIELAATEHRPELVNYLPEKYITSEILDSISKQMITDGVPGSFRRYLKKT